MAVVSLMKERGNGDIEKSVNWLLMQEGVDFCQKFFCFNIFLFLFFGTQIFFNYQTDVVLMRTHL